MLSYFKKHVRKIQAVVSVLVIGLVAYFIASSFSENWDKIKGTEISVNTASVFGLIAFVLSVLVTGLLWGQMLERLAKRPVNPFVAMRVQIASWLLKYIPGQVGSLTGKLTWGMQSGFDKKTVSISFIYENVMLVAASTLPTLPILLFVYLGKIDSSLALVFPFLLVLPMLVFISPKIFYSFVNKSLAIVKKKPLEKSFFLNKTELLGYFVKFLIPRILIAVGFIAVASTVAPVEPHMYLAMGAAYVVAGVIGILILFVPSGLGVREGILTLLLVIYFPFEVAFVMAALARVYATIADILLTGIYAVLRIQEKAGKR